MQDAKPEIAFMLVMLIVLVVWTAANIYLLGV